MKTELKMTVDELELMQYQSEYNDLLIDGIEYDDDNYRARIMPMFNPIEFYDVKGKTGHNQRIVVIWGYKFDDEGNREERRGFTTNDIAQLDYDDFDKCIDRIEGDVAIQWFLPANVDFGSAIIDWRHPDVIID